MQSPRRRHRSNSTGSVSFGSNSAACLAEAGTSAKWCGKRGDSAARRASGSHASTSAAPVPVFELAETTTKSRRLSLGELLVRRPVAALSLVPQPVVLFGAGAIAGAIGKTLTAPLDRCKILLQVKGGLNTGAVKQAAASGGLIRSFIAIGKHEGVMGYWKGNVPQVLRVLPYAAAQLYSYEVFKRLYRREDGSLSVPARLAAGACAGMTSTLLTYPLDTLRLRLAVDPSLRTVRAASMALFREGAYPAFFRGLGTALIGIAPYMALELAAFDLMPQELSSFSRGFAAALIATSFCYPLDTVRRRIQLSSATRLPMSSMLRQVWAEEGLSGFYRGFIPNALKNLPNKGIRLSTFDAAKKLLATSEQAYEEEQALQSTGLSAMNRRVTMVS